MQIIFGLREDLTKTLLDHVVQNHKRPGYNETEELNNSNQSESNTSDHSNVKNGVKLPKTSDQWATAESFFKAELPTHEIGKDNLELITQKLSDTIYDYFDREFGSVVNTSDTEFKVKYKDFLKYQLRKALKTLKSRNLENNLNEVRFVSKLLRSKISSTSTEKNFDDNETDHNKSFDSGFWSYSKKYIDQAKTVLPQFNASSCYVYYKKLFKCSDKSKQFERPTWMPEYERPTVQFNDSPPTYQEITKIIKKMKTSGSPCPLDQISVIVLKWIPYLRSYLTVLIQNIWDT